MITHYFKKRHKGTGVVQGLLAVVMAVGAVDVVAETRIMNEESLVSTQHLVTPMLSLAEAPKHDRKPMAELRIEGQIEAPGYVIIDLQTLQAMNAHSLSTSTVVTDGVLRF